MQLGMMPKDVNPLEVGKHLRLARETAGLTQADAALNISVARTTLIAIEKGRRKIRIKELQMLAAMYNTSVNTILRPESSHVNLVPQFRKPFESKDESLSSAINLLTNLVRAEVELEKILGIKRVQNYPPERQLVPGDVTLQAETNAMELRHRLGLGLAPIRDLMVLLEFDLGIRIYIRPLPAEVSSLFAFDEEIGACMLLNGNHPRERRNQSVAHELGHFISTRRIPEVLYKNDRNNNRIERYANAFGRAFLTPARTVMQKFNEITCGSKILSRRHVILLAHIFNVSREAMVRRLEDLKLTQPHTWDWFEANGGITNDQAREVLGDQVTLDIDRIESSRPTSLRLSLLAAEAWRQTLLSEEQLARLLHLSRIKLRQILDEA